MSKNDYSPHKIYNFKCEPHIYEIFFIEDNENDTGYNYFEYKASIKLLDIETCIMANKTFIGDIFNSKNKVVI